MKEEDDAYYTYVFICRSTQMPLQTVLMGIPSLCCFVTDERRECTGRFAVSMSKPVKEYTRLVEGRMPPSVDTTSELLASR